jgi:putative flavoprotein involved in K+ transport
MTADQALPQVQRNDSSDADVVVIGGGQAGLAVAWHLQQQGLRPLLLEAGDQVGHTWRSRWNSLTLFTPAEYDGLPGRPFPAPAGSYPGKDVVADYLSDYARAAGLRVETNSRVTRLRQHPLGFEVHTSDRVVLVPQVVVATGPFQVPVVPSFAHDLDPSVHQVHSAEYRDPASLPDGSVLVVGGGNSGFQIAEELAASRQVDLAIGTEYPLLPQRVLGRDLFWWLTRTRLLRVPAKSRARPADAGPGRVRHRLRPPPPPGGRGPVPAACDGRVRAHRPVRRREHRERRRRRLGHRLPVGPLLDRRARRAG